MSSVENSYGVNESYGVNGSNGVNWSNGVTGSKGVTGSNGVNWSNGVNESYGVNWSYGVNESYGVNGSNGILNSYGVDNALFLSDKPRTYSIFGKDVSEERFEEVWSNLQTKLNDWYPEFNNAKKLWLKAGKDWKKVDASEITETLKDWQKPYEAWKDMPKEAIEYVKSLPEFDAVMFKRITGIDTNIDEVEITANGKTVKVSRSTLKLLGLE